jgi:hypothetical protein
LHIILFMSNTCVMARIQKVLRSNAIPSSQELHISMVTNLREELHQLLNQELGTCAPASAHHVSLMQTEANKEVSATYHTSQSQELLASLLNHVEAEQQATTAEREAEIAKENLARRMGLVEILSNSEAAAGKAHVNEAACDVEIFDFCALGSPRSAAYSGWLYYEVQILQVFR